ncbi:MAG: hypothetical protein IPP46_13845 [Bacteroidetes bacterium]|nr:hypothetical protein [Bacteroidota bacterium]
MHSTKTVTISPGSSGTPTICINGEFWVKNFVNINSDPINTIIIQNCTLRLGEDAKIKVRGVTKLILKGCLVESCSTSTMWDGLYVDIYDQAAKEPVLEITESLISSNRTIIRDAKNALVLRRDSPFDIDKCDFEDNYVDVLMEKYTKTTNSSTIKSCTFTSTGTLNDPIYNDLKRAAFEMKEIECCTIGAAVNGSENEIENSLYGIYSNNSNFKLLNTEIHDILDDQTTSDLEGSCIESLSDFDINNRLIEIGDGSEEGRNLFYRSMNGIKGTGEMGYIIKKNTFGTINGVSESILDYCISLDNNNSLNKEIQINNNNKFYDYTFGIAIYNPLGKITIKGNDFSNGVYTDPPQGFEGTAINVNRITPAALWGSEISDNTIGETSGPGTVTPKQPRIGIRLSQINSVKVETNDIFFTHNSAPTAQHLGIWAENCSELRIADFNKIDNYFPNFQAVLASMVTGLRLDASPFSCTEQNIFTRMSIGMHITGNSMFNSLYKNEFAEFDQGVFLDNTFIGSSIGTQDPPGSGSGNVMRNKWTCSSCGSLTFNRITGTITSPLDWYHDAGSTSDPEFPDNSVSGGLFSEIELTGTVSDDSECLLPAFPLEEEDTGLPLTLRIRNETLGGIVTDSIRYPNGYHGEFRYTARQMAFGILKKNADLIEMDDDSDTSFVSFYNETVASNINKIDSLETLLSNKLFVEADTLLNHFTDTNTIEHNYKRVYRLYIKLQLYGDTSLTNSDWDELYAIAMLHPLTGGHAVYVAT